MTTEQNKLADELAAISGRCSVENDRVTIIRAVATLRAAGEPVAENEIEAVGWAIVQALHDGIAEGPLSWSDLAQDQEKRIKKAAIAAIETVTDLSQYKAQGFSWPQSAAHPVPSVIAREPTRGENTLSGDMIENMLDRIVEAAVYYENAEGIYNGPAKQELQEAKNAVRAILALSSTPSPLMAAGEAEGVTHACEPMRPEDAANLYGICAAARASVTVEATSPATRDYAARVMGVSAAPADHKVADWLCDQARIVTDSLHCGDNSTTIRQAHNWASELEAVAQRLRSESQAMAEPMREEIAKQLSALVDAIDIYQFSPEGSIEARHASQDLADAVDEAKRILALKPRGGQTREEIEEDDPEVAIVARAIAENGFTRPWDDFFPVNAFDTDQDDLIEYAKAAVAAMRLIALSKPRGEPAREGGE